MEKTCVGRGGRRLRRHTPRGPGAVEFLAMFSWWHSVRVATSGRHTGHLRPGGGRHRRHFGARGWHLRPGHRALARAPAALSHRRQGALDLLVRRGTRSLRPGIAGAHRLRWVCLDRAPGNARAELASRKSSQDNVRDSLDYMRTSRRNEKDCFPNLFRELFQSIHDEFCDYYVIFHWKLLLSLFFFLNSEPWIKNRYERQGRRKVFARRWPTSLFDWCKLIISIQARCTVCCVHRTGSSNYAMFIRRCMVFYLTPVRRPWLS